MRSQINPPWANDFERSVRVDILRERREGLSPKTPEERAAAHHPHIPIPGEDDPTVVDIVEAARIACEAYLPPISSPPSFEPGVTMQTTAASSSPPVNMTAMRAEARAAIANSPNWRAAADDLITWLVDNDLPFSSGEVAALLRTHRPDLVFAATNVGAYLRDQYDDGAFPSYDDSSGPMYPTQVPRTTNGVARTVAGLQVASKTPAGTPVMVYAKEGIDGLAYDFELYVPDGDDPMSLRAVPMSAGLLPGPVTLPAIPGPAPAATAVLITGALRKDDLVAYVAGDGRLYVPRSAFEAFVALTGIPLRGGPNGDPVYVDRVGDAVHITRDRGSSSTAVLYHLWSARGRIAFEAKVVDLPAFTPGDKYAIRVDADALVIALDRKL